MDNIERTDKFDGKIHDEIDMDKYGDMSQNAETSRPDLIECGFCGKSIQVKCWNRHQKTKSHIKNEKAYYKSQSDMCPNFRGNIASESKSKFDITDLYIGKEIEIIKCEADGIMFKNLIPESKHIITEPQYGYKNNNEGVWVLGKLGNPVRVFTHEFKYV